MFKVEREKIEGLKQQELDVLIAETVSNIEVIAKYGEEKITIPLDNETNAKKVRAKAVLLTLSLLKEPYPNNPEMISSDPTNKLMIFFYIVFIKLAS